MMGALFTPAEVSLGQLLDAISDDSPWLARLERDWTLEQALTTPPTPRGQRSSRFEVSDA